MKISSIPYKWLVTVAFVAGLFMDLMDATIVNVALPTLAKNFHASNTMLEWVVNAYLLSLAIWIPASGWIGDKFGTKKTFLFALAMFTLGSTLCGFAWNVESLIFFRVIQGVGGGMMTPVGTAMLFRAFPPHERAKASSIISIPVAIAPAIGPVLGGLLVDTVGWQWIFRVNIPFGIAAFIFGVFFLREHKEETAGRFDVVGFLLSGIALVLLLYSLSVIPSRGFDPLVLGSGIAGVILLVMLVFVERKKSPLLHFSLYKDRMFRISNIIYFLTFGAMLGSLFTLPLFLQQLRGLSALNSGLTTFAQPIGWIFISFIVSRLYYRVGPRTIITVGLVGVTASLLAFLFVDTATNLWIIRLIMFVRGVSLATTVVPLQAAMFSNIGTQETGRASSLYNTNRQVAASFGVALLGTVLFQCIRLNPTSQLFAYHVSFAIAALLSGIGILFALRIRDIEASSSLSAEDK